MRQIEDGAGRWGLWLGGASDRDETRSVAEAVAPFRGRPLGEVEQATAADVERAVTLGHEAARQHRRTPGHVRAGWLHAGARALAEHAADLVDTLVATLGKPRRASEFEVGRGVQLLDLAAEEISRFGGENLPLDGVPGGDGRWGLTRREPFGVVAAVTPFNAPVNLLLQKVAPALAVGNAVVVKPAPEGAIVALQIAELLGDALPPGLLSVLPGGPEIARGLASHPQVRAVTLTGGVAAGRAVMAAAGIKPVLLELGSNAPNIVLADADLDDAAASIAHAAFGASGQQCISAQRVIVERPAFDAFVGRFVAAAQAMVVGDPDDPATEIGPLAHKGRRDAVARFVTDAEERGAKLLLDGRPDRDDDLCFGPTVVVDAPPDAMICRDEVFGPVAVVLPADSLDHAVAIANDSPFGLQAACFTRSLSHALRAAEDIAAGSVWINESTRFRLDTTPFGGYGQSGVGREGVRYAMEALSQLKFVGLRLTPDS
ncbi:MAG TPA: aldehyde dehydrogenase family protein [Acidimicrobiales bacterium]|nr:aldehyde dehydrogenase family protein [Acidimicrobiales bacterium]